MVRTPQLKNVSIEMSSTSLLIILLMYILGWNVNYLE